MTSLLLILIMLLTGLTAPTGGPDIPGPAPEPLPEPGPGVTRMEHRLLEWTEMDYPVLEARDAIDAPALFHNQADWAEFLAAIPPEFTDLSAAYSPDEDEARMPNFDANVAVLVYPPPCRELAVDASAEGTVEVLVAAEDPSADCTFWRHFAVYEVPLSALGDAEPAEVQLLS